MVSPPAAPPQPPVPSPLGVPPADRCKTSLDRALEVEHRDGRQLSRTFYDLCVGFYVYCDIELKCTDRCDCGASDAQRRGPRRGRAGPPYPEPAPHDRCARRPTVPPRVAAAVFIPAVRSFPNLQMEMPRAPGINTITPSAFDPKRVGESISSAGF